jgi:hypothetical protein
MPYALTSTLTAGGGPQFGAHPVAQQIAHSSTSRQYPVPPRLEQQPLHNHGYAHYHTQGPCNPLNSRTQAPQPSTRRNLVSPLMSPGSTTPSRSDDRRSSGGLNQGQTTKANGSIRGARRNAVDLHALGVRKGGTCDTPDINLKNRR